MRNSGVRLISPLMFLALIFPVVGFHSSAHPTPGRPTQTRPTQTRPTKTQTARVKKASQEKPLVFTDDDLKRYHSAAEAPPAHPAAAKPTPPPGDPLKPFHDREERARWRQEKISQMQQHVLDLEEKLKSLQQKRLSIVNPYVPRLPEGEAEKASETGLSGPELLARTDAEIKETSDQLETARKELASFLQTPSE